MNYAISMLMQVYFIHRAVETGGVSYGILSETASACHEAEEEWRRRMIVPYEDAKKEEHGDVYFPVVENDD